MLAQVFAGGYARRFHAADIAPPDFRRFHGAGTSLCGRPIIHGASLTAFDPTADNACARCVALARRARA